MILYISNLKTSSCYLRAAVPHTNFNLLLAVVLNDVPSSLLFFLVYPPLRQIRRFIICIFLAKACTESRKREGGGGSNFAEENIMTLVKLNKIK